MIALVTGGASSGKSAWAERLALSLPGPHAYVAAMRHGDAETEERIARHRAARAGKGFATVELAAGCEVPAGVRTVLVEDLGNLLANGLQERLPGLLAFPNAVVVTDEVGCDGVPYRGATLEFIRDLGSLSADVARRADAVVEVTAGLPCAVKGEVAL